MYKESIYEARFLIRVDHPDKEITDEFTIEFAHETDSREMEQEATLIYMDYHPEFREFELLVELINCHKTN